MPLSIVARELFHGALITTTGVPIPKPNYRLVSLLTGAWVARNSQMANPNPNLQAPALL